VVVPDLQCSVGGRGRLAAEQAAAGRRLRVQKKRALLIPCTLEQANFRGRDDVQFVRKWLELNPNGRAHVQCDPSLARGGPNGSPPRAIHQPRKIPIRTIVQVQAVFQKAQMRHRNPTKPLCK